MRASSLVALSLLAGCAEDETYLIITVDKRPAVHGATDLKVTLSNEGSMRTDDLDLSEKPFPVTFSVSAPGRTGALGISIDALDGNGSLVGRGTGTTDLASMTGSVVIDSADFVVNTDYANAQFLSNDFEANGLQLAATPSGNWMTVFRDECTMCSIFGRRFDATGLPINSTIAAGTNAFPVSTSLTTGGSIPAVAGSAAGTMVFWDYFEPGGGAINGVGCRMIDGNGAGGTAQQVLIGNDSADVVTAAALSNGNFAVTWQSLISNNVIRSVIVRPDCTSLAAPVTVSTAVGTFGARRSHVSGHMNATIVYTWIVDGEVYTRPASNAGVFAAGETKIIPKTASMEVEHVRIIPYQTGHALAVRWASTAAGGPGKIDLYKLDTMGQIVSGTTPTLISDKSGSDFASNRAFGLAARTDGALLVTWHMCSTGMAGSCDVFGRLVRPTGVPVGDELVIPTSNGSDQKDPSVIALDTTFVVAWTDSSGLEPDRSESAVRARVLYPVYDEARGVIGATCGASAPGAPACGDGLACGTGSDTVQRCFAVCTPPSCPGGGTCSTVDGGTSACIF